MIDTNIPFHLYYSTRRLCCQQCKQSQQAPVSPADNEGPVTIVAVGNVVVTGNTKLDPDDIPFIISTQGNITITGNSWTSAMLYAPSGSITMSGNSKVYGCVIGESITATGNNVVQYLSVLSERSDLPGGRVNILTYAIDG